MEIVSSPQVSNFSEQPTCVEIEVDGTAVAEAAAVVDESSAGTSVDCTVALASSPQKPNEAAEQSSSSSHVTEAKDIQDESELAGTENISEADEAFAEETAADQAEDSQQLSNESK